jgi:hypothetical protein
MTAKALENGATANNPVDAINLWETRIIVCTLKDGRVVTQIDEDDLSTDVYFRFQKISVQYKENPQEAMRWLMVRLFLIDGKPLTIEHLSEKPPVGIGFTAAALLGNITATFLRGLPSPKKSSISDDLAAGDWTTFED